MFLLHPQMRSRTFESLGVKCYISFQHVWQDVLSHVCICSVSLISDSPFILQYRNKSENVIESNFTFCITFRKRDLLVVWVWHVWGTCWANLKRHQSRKATREREKWLPELECLESTWFETSPGWIGPANDLLCWVYLHSVLRLHPLNLVNYLGLRGGRLDGRWIHDLLQKVGLLHESTIVRGHSHAVPPARPCPLLVHYQQEEIYTIYLERF